MRRWVKYQKLFFKNLFSEIKVLKEQFSVPYMDAGRGYRWASSRVRWLG